MTDTMCGANEACTRPRGREEERMRALTDLEQYVDVFSAEVCPVCPQVMSATGFLSGGLLLLFFPSSSTIVSESCAVDDAGPKSASGTLAPSATPALAYGPADVGDTRVLESKVRDKRESMAIANCRFRPT